LRFAGEEPQLSPSADTRLCSVHATSSSSTTSVQAHHPVCQNLQYTAVNSCKPTLDYDPKSVYKQYTHINGHCIDPKGFVDSADLVESNVTTIIKKRSEGLNKALLDTLLPSLCALQLAQWYWDEGPSKSMQLFQSLINIIGSEEFEPAEIRNTNWQKVYAILGLSVDDDQTPDGLKTELGEWFRDNMEERGCPRQRSLYC
jgi:hypothetical protein